MADDKSDISEELMEAVKNTDKMAHVETRTTKSEVALKLKCSKCGTLQDFAVHHDLMMELQEDQKTLKCAHEECDHTEAVPTHCDQVMQPFITGN